MDEKLRDNDFRFVERLLYEYSTNESSIEVLGQELSELLDTLLPIYKETGVSSTPGVSDSEPMSEPERYTIKRDEHLHVKYLRRRIDEKRSHQLAVAKAREALTDEELRFVELFYDQNRTARDCKRIMYCEKSKMYSLRQRVVHKVARFIGLL